MSSHLALDAAGFPVLLAEVPEAAPSTPPAPAAEPPAPPPSSRPSTTDSLEWARRQDAVRDAAREFEPLSPQDLQERLRGVTTRPLTPPDLAQFTADVRHAVLDDLVDVLDQNTRGKLRSRRTVRLNSPRGYLVKTMRALTAPEADQVESRLRSRGWNDKQIKDDLRGKLPHLAEAPAPAEVSPA